MPVVLQDPGANGAKHDSEGRSLGFPLWVFNRPRPEGGTGFPAGASKMKKGLCPEMAFQAADDYAYTAFIDILSVTSIAPSHSDPEMLKKMNMPLLPSP